MKMLRFGFRTPTPRSQTVVQRARTAGTRQGGMAFGLLLNEEAGGRGRHGHWDHGVGSAR